LLGAVALWSGNWVAVRYIVQAMPRWQALPSGCCFPAYYLLLYVKLTTGKTLSLQNIKIFAFLGLMHFGFNFLQYTGLTWTTAVNGSLINATTPIFIILLSRVIIKEKLSGYQLLGVLVSFLGVGWIITKGSWTLINSLTFNLGDIFMIIAVCCWSLFTIFSRKQTLATSAAYVSAYATMFSFIYFLPFTIAQCWGEQMRPVSWILRAAVIYTIGVAVFGLVFWNKGVGLIGPARASVFMNLMPLFTLVLAFALLGETIAGSQLLGGIFVIGGVYLTSASRFLPKNEAPANKTA
jgi:drug/metabolite transporter (DMT)-like permease